jgi:ketosteroid isomerase-like protein
MPLSHPNAEVAKRLWSAVAEGDAVALKEILSPDVVWRSVGQSRVSGEYRNPPAVIEYLATIGEIADDLVSTLESVFVNEDGAVVFHRATATRGDRTLVMDYVIRLGIENGKIHSALSIPVDQPENDAFWS